MGTKSLTAITGTVYLFYMIIGGVLFMVLDEYHALDMISREKSNTTAVFTDMETVLLENFPKSQIEGAIIEWKREFTEVYFSNETVELTDIDWTYANSFFFAFHLCSTVGYGDIYPSTSYGQLFVVFYTSVGMPLHVLLFTMIGESFARSYQEIMIRVKGDQDAPLRRTLGYLGFFLPWIIVFYVLPSIAFIFMENWDFIDGVYYCFITLTTIGLGDYIAGSKVISKITYTLYKLLIFFWMLYGLAFTEMIVNFMAHLYQMYLLFSFECSCRKCKCKFERQYVDVEKMDIHFRLIRAEDGPKYHYFSVIFCWPPNCLAGQIAEDNMMSNIFFIILKFQAVKPEYSMWSVRESTRQAVGFRTNHMVHIAVLSERIQGELMELLRLYISSSTEVVTAKSMKDVSKIIPKDKSVMKKSRRDAFPVRTRADDNSV